VKLHEDIVDTAVLGVAAALSILGLAVMVARARGDAVAAAAIYGSTLIAAYLSAALFRIVRRPRPRAILQAVDHCSIYLLIAGTYTPFALLALQDHLGWLLFAAVWLLAVAGISVRLAARVHLKRLAPLVYVIQGWFGLAWAGALVRTAGLGALVLIVAGGVIYTAGLAFYFRTRSRYANVFWHLSVISGSALHYAAVAYYVVPVDLGRIAI
jgi:hemolysin III